MISLGTRMSCNATPISTAFFRFEPFTSITTSRSTSLSGPPSPRACEPNRITRSGLNSLTIRSTISRICFLTVFSAAIVRLATY